MPGSASPLGEASEKQQGQCSCQLRSPINWPQRLVQVTHTITGVVSVAPQLPFHVRPDGTQELQRAVMWCSE